MTKLDLIKKVSYDTGIDQTTTSIVLEGVLRGIKSSISEGETIFLRGFGTWSSKRKSKKVARNINTGETIILQERKVPHFKPCKEFTESLKR